MKQGYRVTGLDRSGTRRTITTVPGRKEALMKAREAKGRGVREVRIEILQTEPVTEELSRKAQRRQAEERARRKGRI